MAIKDIPGHARQAFQGVSFHRRQRLSRLPVHNADQTHRASRGQRYGGSGEKSYRLLAGHEGVPAHPLVLQRVGNDQNRARPHFHHTARHAHSRGDGSVAQADQGSEFEFVVAQDRYEPQVASNKAQAVSTTRSIALCWEGRSLAGGDPVMIFSSRQVFDGSGVSVLGQGRCHELSGDCVPARRTADAVEAVDGRSDLMVEQPRAGLDASETFLTSTIRSSDPLALEWMQ